MKAQAAIEFVTSYAWVLLVIIVMAVSAYYFISVIQQTPPQCDFGVEFPCRSYQFFKKSDRTMMLSIQLTNGMGKSISFSGKNQIITVQNIGKSGVNNYTGTCIGPAFITKGGDTILCLFNITDKEVIPSTGTNVKFSVLLNYTNCETDPLYPLFCSNGTNRSLYGGVVPTVELKPAVVAPYCMDGECNGGENYNTCPWDCPPPKPASLTLKSTSDCLNATRINVPIQINVTVKDQYNHYMGGVPVLVFLYDGFGVGTSAISYTLTPSIPITDANGLARVNLTWYDCCASGRPCISPFDCNMFVFYIGATADSVTATDPRCSWLKGLDLINQGCCG
jgi:hypothetical protein